MKKNKLGQLPDEGFIRLEQVLEVIPVSRSTWFRGIQQGLYPTSIKLGNEPLAGRFARYEGVLKD